ncbi:MAG TPA: ATP-binding cassette domain-containing protein [Candidatus Limnocylindrales bacterium]|nr:ATP-binding cassette domain-containing protein [Candidatus Limnocylindrales bacterium]
MSNPAAADRPAEAPILAEGLTRHFGAAVAVDALDLSVATGEIMGLLGPNGAGKTTTIKMLTTLLRATAGSAVVAGADIRSAPGIVRRRIGYVPQLVSADGSLTGRENLEVSARLYHVPRPERASTIGETLAFMGLEDAADRMVRTYSGGMVRRLEIAQAMLHRPAVLFLDEPTVGLDPTARTMVWDRVRGLREQHGTTVLLTTHYMNEADELCDRIGIMLRGRLVEVGRPDDLKRRLAPDASLEDVFADVTGAEIETGGTFRDVGRTRRTAKRLG